jgi:hypothetical protein
MPKKVANSQNCTNFAVASSILVTENKKAKQQNVNITIKNYTLIKPQNEKA